MAEAVVSGHLQVIIEKLASPILEQCERLWGVREEMGKLRSTLSTINAVLEDAKEKQPNSKALQDWLGKLKCVVYDADDTLDDFTSEVEAEAKVEAKRRKVEIGDYIKKVCNFFSASNPLVSRSNMTDKIKEIVRRLDAIAEEGERVLEILRREPTDSFVIESDVYGMEEYRKRLMELLISEDNGEDVTVIPIVGMGGLGKTTLAQLAFNDERTATHFELRMWVDDFSVSRETKDIIESATNSKCDLQNMDQLQCRLRELLSGKKFLLVLDDIWEENPQNWDRLKQFLRGGARDSKIIVTTRSEKVASIMGTIPSYHLPGLSEADCWSLFKQRAFGHGRQEHPNLVMLGKIIVKKCGGVPLAAKMLGSLMHLKTEEKEWLLVCQSEIWNLSEEDDHILPALKLSYYHLPSHLKQCFAYCSIFPKDYIIQKKQLIQLWMAQGFLQSSDGNKKMEDIGGEYFNNLLWRSFFQEVEKDDDGNIEWCKIHDLVHDLACSVAGNECSILKVKNAISISDMSPARCFTLDCEFSNRVLTLQNDSRTANHLGTLLVLRGRNVSVPRELLVHFTCLRELDLSHANVSLVSIGELKQLRYLNLSYTKIQALPESICTLHHLPGNMGELKFLEVLVIQGMDALKRIDNHFYGGNDVIAFPSLKQLTIGDMPNLEEWLGFNRREVFPCLKQVIVDECPKLESIPRELGNLAAMESLQISGCNKLVSLLEDLQNLISLQTLYIYECDGRTSLRLQGLSSLQDPTIMLCPELAFLPEGMQHKLSIRGCEKLTSLPEGLQHATTLQQLNIRNCKSLTALPEWIGNLTSLQHLEIEDCDKLVCLPSGLQLLTNLQTLKIRRLPSLTAMPEGIGNLSLLQNLEMRDCYKLVCLSSGLQLLTKLRTLSIYGCPQLKKRCEKEKGEDWRYISHIPYIYIG